MIFLKVKKKDILIFTIVFLLLGALFYFSRPSIILNENYSVFKESSLPKLQVATSFPLVADWIKSVGKDRVQVSIFSSLTDPTLDVWLNSPSYNKVNQEVKIFFKVGSNLDDWADQLSLKSSESKVKIEVFDIKPEKKLDLSYKNLLGSNLSLKKEESEYYWLSLENARQSVGKIARYLGKVDGVNREYYINNAYKYSIELDSLLSQSLDVLSNMKNKRVALADILLSPLAEGLKLDVIGVFDLKSANGVLPNLLASQVIKAIKANKIKTIICDSNLKNRDFGKIVAQTTASLAAIDVWGINSDSYINFMRLNISELLRSL